MGADCDLFETAGSCRGVALRCADAARFAFERGEDVDRSARGEWVDLDPVVLQNAVEFYEFSHAECLGAPGNLRA